MTGKESLRCTQYKMRPKALRLIRPIRTMFYMAKDAVNILCSRIQIFAGARPHILEMPGFPHPSGVLRRLRVMFTGFEKTNYRYKAFDIILWLGSLQLNPHSLL
jgi:hypothetical protein